MLESIDVPPGMYLLPEVEDINADFRAGYEDSGCTCFISPPCGFCTHYGNPRNINECDHIEVFGISDVSEWADWLVSLGQLAAHRKIDEIFSEALSGR